MVLTGIVIKNVQLIFVNAAQFTVLSAAPGSTETSDIGCDDGLAEKQLVVVRVSFCKRDLSGELKQPLRWLNQDSLCTARLLLPLTSPPLAVDSVGFTVGRGRIF